MSYIQQALGRDEEILHLFNLNKYTLAIPYFLFTIAFGVLILGAISPGDISPLIYLGVAVITFIAGIVNVFQLKSLEYGVTTVKIIFKKGIIARDSDEIHNVAVETIELDQGIFGRLFGFGNVIIRGRGNSTITMENLDEPLKVKIALEEAVFNNR